MKKVLLCLVFASLFIAKSFAQGSGNNLFTITAVRTYNPISVKTTYTFTITKTGAQNALSHLGFPVAACPGAGSVSNALNGFVGETSTNGTTWSRATTTYGPDPSTEGTCTSGDVLKFDEGMGNALIKLYRLTLNGTQLLSISTAYIKYGNDCINLSTGLTACSQQAALAPLPVTFKSFTASRNKQNVGVKWQTASEQNNKGFNVQRKTTGNWVNVAFVFSLANGGNSSSDLSYAYNDANTEKGITQYRVMQVDLDGRSAASEIRSVRGEDIAAARMVVYPNPSMDGRVNVMFEEGNGNRSVVVSDMSGRRVKQYRNVSSNTLVIEGLENGVYSIQVTDLTSSALSVEKVIIKKR